MRGFSYCDESSQISDRSRVLSQLQYDPTDRPKEICLAELF